LPKPEFIKISPPFPAGFSFTILTDCTKRAFKRRTLMGDEHDPLWVG